MQFTTQQVTKWLRLAQSQNMCECVCWHIYTGYKNIRKKSNIILQFATFSQNGHDLPSWQLVLILLVTHRLCKLPVYFNITLPLFLYLTFIFGSSHSNPFTIHRLCKFSHTKKGYFSLPLSHFLVDFIIFLHLYFRLMNFCVFL